MNRIYNQMIEDLRWASQKHDYALNQLNHSKENEEVQCGETYHRKITAILEDYRREADTATARGDKQSILNNISSDTQQQLNQLASNYQYHKDKISQKYVEEKLILTSTFQEERNNILQACHEKARLHYFELEKKLHQEYSSIQRKINQALTQPVDLVKIQFSNPQERDEMVRRVQQWLNETFSNNPDYDVIPENGNTGWTTVFALTRALQIELGISPTSDSFGPTTLEKVDEISPFGQGDLIKENILKILEGGFYCKGYNPGGFEGVFDSGTESAVSSMFNDMTGQFGSIKVTAKFFKALLTMDPYILLTGGNPSTRIAQQWLNRTYIHRQNFFYIPCDGFFSRDVQKALLFAIQYEIGMDDATANGNFGPGTQAGLRENTLTVGMSNNFVRLFQCAMAFNGYQITLDGIFSQSLSNLVSNFQDFCALPVTGIGDYQTWASLLVSTGDPNRNTPACDSIYEVTLQVADYLTTNGYTTIGRYLTQVEGGLEKAIKPGELQRIFNAGMSCVPIYQTLGSYVGYFSTAQGKNDALLASNAALSFGFRQNTVIYFAVDFDATDYDISSNILSYFQGISSKMNDLGNFYRVGIYGSRNVCSRVSNAGYAFSSYVAGMSTGFSGNLGFALPSNWAFDQIQEVTISSLNPPIGLDRCVKSGRYNGEISIDSNGELLQQLAYQKLQALLELMPLLNTLATIPAFLWGEELIIVDIPFPRMKASVILQPSLDIQGLGALTFKDGKWNASFDSLLPQLTPFFTAVGISFDINEFKSKLGIVLQEGWIELKYVPGLLSSTFEFKVSFVDYPLSNGTKGKFSIKFKIIIEKSNDDDDIPSQYQEVLSKLLDSDFDFNQALLFVVVAGFALSTGLSVATIIKLIVEALRNMIILKEEDK